MKRVRIQSAHGILIPGGANSPRRAMWRSRHQTLAYLAAALVLYGLLCNTRNLLRDAAIIPDVPREPTLVYEESSGTVLAVATHEDCPEYGHYASRRHEPTTRGRYDLPYQRPARACRKVVVPEVEEVIQEMNRTIKDPDLFRLFENCFPNTLDTSVTWTGVSSTNANEELTFITTGDIHAMWLRDSANQLQSYVSLLKPPRTAQPKDGTPAPSRSSSSNNNNDNNNNKLASLFRGAINLQARYILASPHCNAFQPPVEAGMAPGNDGNGHDLVFPHYDRDVVFECKYELDSLAAFLQLSWDYFSRTKDARFFVDASVATRGPRRRKQTAGTAITTTTTTTTTTGRKDTSGRRTSTRRRRRRTRKRAGWRDAVATILDAAEGMRAGTYTPEGMVPGSPYRFERASSVPTETLGNRGNGSPVRAGTGLVRSAFRPSDDAATFQLLVPANMMLARYLELCAEIMAKVEKEEDRLAAQAGPQGYYAQGVLDPEGAGGEELDGGRGGEDEDEDADEDEDEEGGEAEAEGGGEAVADRMRRMAKEIKKGIEKHGKIKHPEFGEIYAYEVDGYWSSNMMDDANLPSLLSSPLTGYVPRTDPVYRATRRFALSTANPYYDHGPVINGTGGPHVGPGMVWPMSLVVGIMTTDDDDEIRGMLSQLLASTDGLGLIHESVNVWNQNMWTRSWFSWANGLFGQMILDLKERKPHILKTSFQGER